MLTVHTAGSLLPGGGSPAVPGGAVAVRGREIAAVGPYETVLAAHPDARVRRWPGTITPGLVHPYGVWLLEHAYHPDPREADALGSAPLTGAALTALGPDDARWGGSARRGAQRLLAHGVTVLAGTPVRPSVADAIARTGLTVLPTVAVPGGGAVPEPGAVPGYGAPEESYAAVLDDPRTAGTRAVGTRAVGVRADFAVFEAGECVATVLAGRLVHRRR
ncbi:hypothetical protein AB0G74_13780 [Streptomyces sp. NPDC020875]|uniref:imidazolonepropionase-like domain-containing protein n=1 Tax=Streptomyces sp. NPDC020875 TaxID=3154898 RepID=UPI0033E2744B